MTCVEFQSKLSAYADGELSRWTRWKVQQHLGHCPDCAGLLREFEEVDSSLLGSLALDPAPTYLTEAVMRRLPAMPPPWRRPATVARWATAGALAGVQLLAVYGAYWWGFARGTSAPAHGAARTGFTAPVGATLRVNSREPWNEVRTERPESLQPVSLWGRREMPGPFALPGAVGMPSGPDRVPLTPVMSPGGAH